MRKNIIICGAIFSITVAVYLFTMCPTIYWEDSAAFSAAHSILGIPHSPGFPIYVILGKIFTLLPLENFAFESNLMSAFWGSLCLIVLYLIMIALGQGFNLSPYKEVRAGVTPLPDRVRAGVQSPPEQVSPSSETESLGASGSLTRRGSFFIYPLGGGLFFAFSSAFWLQTIRAEVYTLNMFLTLILIFLLIKWSQPEISSTRFKILLLFSFFFGLSLTNHPLLMITLAPAFLFFLLITDLKFFLSPKRVFILSAFFFLGISLYLYLPIRSSQSPFINWGTPDTFPGLLSYLLRTSQPTAPASDSSVPYLTRLGFNLSFPVHQFGLPFFWLGVVGAVSLFKSYRRIFLFTFSIFLLNVLTATWATDFSLRNYDLLGYLLPSFSMFAIWFAFGLDTIVNWMLQKVKNLYSHADQIKLGCLLRFITCGIVLLLPLSQIRKNFHQCDKSSQVWAYRYASQILNSAKKDALILVGDDNTLTSLWYLNLACGQRPDVKILSISSLIQKSYREQISRQYGEVRLSTVQLKNLGEIAYEVSRLNVDAFPIYSTHFFSPHSFSQHLSPVGYLFEFHANQVILTDKDIEAQSDFLKKSLGNKNFDTITREHFGNIVFNLGAFYDNSGKGAKSIEYFLWALEIDPSNPRIYFQLGKAFLKNGDRAKALDFLEAGLELDPYNLEARKLLERT